MSIINGERRSEGRGDDPDQDFLDTLIKFAHDIRVQVEIVKGDTDNPEVLYSILKIEGAALMIRQITRNYRPRLKHLKREAARAASGFTIKRIEEG